MRFLRSLIFVVWLYASMAILGIVVAPFTLFSSRAALATGRAWARTTLAAARVLCGIHVELRGLDNLPPEPFLLAMKHQAMLDTFIPFFVAREPSIVLKRELLNMPIFGWYAKRAGFIPIDREAGASALKGMVRAARAAFERGRVIVIFPEGTRQEIGAPPDYKPGVAALYRDLNAPCVPAALNSGVCWPAHGVVRKPGRVVIEFLPPIPAGLSRKDFMRTLETAIETRTNALVADSRT